MNGLRTLVTPQLPMGHQPVEYVERKGLGHPDTICDSVMEAIGIALAEAYIKTAGRVLHFNVDKGLLAAGQSQACLGGGKIVAPMKLFVGDRATDTYGGTTFPISQIVETTARAWFEKHLRFVQPGEHLEVHNEMHHGSAELMGIFDRSKIPANDTSVGVGYAPLSETECLVLAAERFLNSGEFKLEFPETGEDVKVMAVRHGRKVSLVVAVAFIDRFISSVNSYLDRKLALHGRLLEHLQSELRQLDSIELSINALDDPQRGQDGLYLTVLGTSAESGDGGQVGRGNRVNGLINFSRPMTLEAAAGKNPVSHVGKIYNVLSHQIAHRICQASDAVDEAYVWLCSRIGQPLDEPWSATVQLALANGAVLTDVENSINDILHEELSTIYGFTEKLTRGEFPIC